MARRRSSEPGAHKRKPRRAGSPVPSERAYWGAAFPVVGIGASAGGLEAATALLKDLPPKPGMAFVLVQHLDPVHESMLAKLLAKDTEMRVAQVEQGMKVEADHLYVIPPNKSMVIRHGVLRVSSRRRGEGKFMPIDHFFTSLAEDQKSRAIGVILSGTATDGTLGLQAIKAEGGITFAQDRKSAKYPGMPLSAVAAGSVDFVLPPGEIAKELWRMGQHPYVARPVAAPDVELPYEGKDDFQKVLALVRSATGVDFSLYKPATIRRRVARQMALQKIDRLARYAQYLQKHPAETKALYEDILIHVTGFFREPESFEALRKLVFPKLIAGRQPGGAIRVWVPGCSTGEEVYSIAMTLVESMGPHLGEIPIQIFGTDISIQAIDKARMGIYAESSVAALPGEYLRRFFVRTEGGYQVSKAVRDMCVFARHDLAKDPPFSRLDLVSCRNVLIYMGPVLQKRVMAILHYALKPGGSLVLGRSEALSAYPNLFQLEDRRGKVYARRETPPSPMFELAALDYHDKAAARPAPARKTVEFDLQRAAERIIWQRYSPAAFVVNADLQVLHFQGDTSRYLAPAPGAATLHLLRLVREELVMELRTLTHKVKKEDAPARKEGLHILENDLSKEINLEVIPIKGRNPRGSDLLILLEEVPLRGTGRPGTPTEPVRQNRHGGKEVARLKRELSATRQYLQSIIEDQETTNEELKAANEEVLSSNEELQSTNEELETAKEELQSGNEELTTLNDELQNRYAELNQLANDLSNLLVGVNIPIVILGSDRKIRRFTPTAEKLLNLIPSDVGRPISDLKPNVDIPDLDHLISETLSGAGTLEREVRDHEGRWYLLRMRPYRTSEDRIEGVLMALVDIDAVTRSRDQVAAERDFSKALLDTVGALVVVTGPDRRILLFNRASQESTGYTFEEVKGRRPCDFLIPAEEMHIAEAAYARLEEGTERVCAEYQWAGKDGVRRLVSWASAAMGGSGESPRYFISAGIDITARRAAEGLQFETAAALRVSEGQLRSLTGRLLRVQEEEQSRIARELHDEFNQKLAALTIELETLEKDLPLATRDVVQRKLQAAEEAIRKLSDGIHDLARRIHPSMVELLGLVPALGSLCSALSRQDGVAVRFVRRRVPEKIPIDIAMCLYRVTQEALRNVAKHSGAATAEVRLTGTGKGLRLTVSDRGSGFDVSEAKKTSGIGLISVQERVRLIGGALTVRSEPGHGTEVSVKIPVLAQVQA